MGYEIVRSPAASYWNLSNLKRRNEIASLATLSHIAHIRRGFQSVSNKLSNTSRNNGRRGGRKCIHHSVACIIGSFGEVSEAEGIGVDAILFSLMTLATQWLRPRYNARMQLLEAQISNVAVSH